MSAWGSMHHEEPKTPTEEDRQEFKKRRRRQHIFNGVMLLVSLALFLSEWLANQAHPGEEVSYLLLGIVTVYVVFTSWNWRCPVCGKHFGRRWDPIYCFGCDTRYDEDDAQMKRATQTPREHDPASL